MRMHLSSRWIFYSVVLLSLVVASATVSGQSTPPQSASQQTKPEENASPEAKEFMANVQKYLDVQKKAVSKVPALSKKEEDPAVIAKHQQQCADAIKALRPNAKRGEIFTPVSAKWIKANLKQALKGQAGAAARKTLLGEGNPKAESAKPINLAINATYPPSAPFSTVPPSVLMALPTLPKELEFRFVGRDVIVRDTLANIIVDVLHEAV
jgi:hypothetical protein